MDHAPLPYTWAAMPRRNRPRSNNPKTYSTSRRRRVPETFRLPGDDEHMAIIGRNGSGKTQFATWVLSERSFDRMPWIVLNFKEEPIFDEINQAREFKLTDKIPSQPGIYVCDVVAFHEKDAETLDQFFFHCWQHRNVGIFVDEGYNATGLKWFRACLSQGRSRNVPMVVLSQRPVWMDKFVWSEASRYAAFDLNITDDKITASKMIPGYKLVRLQPFHCVWHDVKTKQTMILSPCPDRDRILRRFRERSRIVHKAL